MNSIEPLTPAHHRGAAVVLADAFLDDIVMNGGRGS
jgi:hypothetical protein